MAQPDAPETRALARPTQVETSDTVVALDQHEEPAPDCCNSLTREQVCAARAMLGWSVRELAERSGVPISTVVRMEASAVSTKEADLDSIRDTLTGTGIHFFNDPEGYPAVSMKLGI